MQAWNCWTAPRLNDLKFMLNKCTADVTAPGQGTGREIGKREGYQTEDKRRNIWIDEIKVAVYCRQIKWPLKELAFCGLEPVEYHAVVHGIGYKKRGYRGRRLECGNEPLASTGTGFDEIIRGDLEEI